MCRSRNQAAARLGNFLYSVFLYREFSLNLNPVCAKLPPIWRPGIFGGRTQMDRQFDLVIQSGLVVDGRGGEPFEADVGWLYSIPLI